MVHDLTQTTSLLNDHGTYSTWSKLTRTTQLLNSCDAYATWLGSTRLLNHHDIWNMVRIDMIDNY